MISAAKPSPSDVPLTAINTIALPLPLVLTCIKIVPALKVVFFGTDCGTLGWLAYPLRTKANLSLDNEEGSSLLVDPYCSLKVHNSPINYIGLTPNNRFLIVSVKKSGYLSFRIRWQKSLKDNQVSLAFHELGNPILNTIDVSSCSLFETNKDRLKIALEKRKTCFNDLE